MSAASTIAAPAATAPSVATLPTMSESKTELGNQRLACMKDAAKEVLHHRESPASIRKPECRRQVTAA
jgi:hypothetical protein